MQRLPRFASTLLLACLLAAACGPAAATDKAEKTVKHRQRTATPKVIPSGSTETTRERERRLLRECKGRPNAGACAGYAS